MEVHVVPVPWSTHSDQLQAVRNTVFIQEQGVPQEVEWDGHDEGATHFLALNEAGQTIGCARLLGDKQPYQTTERNTLGSASLRSF